MGTDIRIATIEDAIGITGLILKFFEESLQHFGFTICTTSALHTSQTFILQHIIFVAEKKKKIMGVIGGVVLPSIFNSQQRLGQEIIWYVEKKERAGTVGIRLIKAFERECKRYGASLICMVHMSNLYADKLGKVYKQMNYTDLETQYIKEFK